MTTLARQIGGGFCVGFTVGCGLTAGWLTLGPLLLGGWLTLIVCLVAWIHVFGFAGGD